MPAQGVGRHTSGGKKLHKAVIFPDFSAFHSDNRQRSGSAAGAPPEALPPEPADRPRPAPGARTGQTSGICRIGTAGHVPPQGRLAAPPFSWLGVDAWPHSPAWADNSLKRGGGTHGHNPAAPGFAARQGARAGEPGAYRRPCPGSRV